MRGGAVIVVDGIELRFLSLGNFGGATVPYFGANASTADTTELSFDVFSLTGRGEMIVQHAAIIDVWGSPGTR